MNALFVQLALGGGITAADPPARFWRLAEQLSGIVLLPTDTPEEAAAKCLKALAAVPK